LEEVGSQSKGEVVDFSHSRISRRKQSETPLKMQNQYGNVPSLRTGKILRCLSKNTSSPLLIEKYNVSQNQ
jgi:hypothetical protein